MVFGFRSLCCRFACESSLQTGRYTWVQRGFLALCWWSQILLSRPINPEPSHDKLDVRRVGGQLGERRAEGSTKEELYRTISVPLRVIHMVHSGLIIWNDDKQTLSHRLTFSLPDRSTDKRTKGVMVRWKADSPGSAVYFVIQRQQRVNNCLNDDGSITYYQSVRKQRVMSLNWLVLFFLDR